MTIETRGTIELADVLAVEYECANQSCRARVIRPLERSGGIAVPRACGNCGSSWFTDPSQEAQELKDFLETIARYKGAKLPFVLRFEVSGLDQIRLRLEKR